MDDMATKKTSRPRKRRASKTTKPTERLTLAEWDAVHQLCERVQGLTSAEGKIVTGQLQAKAEKVLQRYTPPPPPLPPHE